MIISNKYFLYGSLIITITTTVGCGVSTQNQMQNLGESPLDAESLYALVADNSLELTAIDFDAQIYFQENGRLSAKTISGETDSGTWDITSDKMLCLEFSKWYFGDEKCYSVFPEPDTEKYIFFTSNGARYYTGIPLTTIPQSLLTNTTKEKRSSYLKDRNTQPESSSNYAAAPLPVPAPAPSSEEMKHLMATTARNCPGCNLSGVELSQTDLIGANLQGANLSGANLTGTNLRRANLSGINLKGANLQRANLTGANLTKSNLQNADFTGANLIKANFTGSTTEGIILQDALLESTTGIK